MTKTSTKDPVCGMTVEMTADRARSYYKGEAYYFCCSGCKKKFDQAPENYLSDSAGGTKSDKSGCCCG
jgi:YHS domain-containing protein